MSLVGIDFKAPLREVKRVQFGILSPDEIVSLLFDILSDSKYVLRSVCLCAK